MLGGLGPVELAGRTSPGEGTVPLALEQPGRSGIARLPAQPRYVPCLMQVLHRSAT